MPDDVHADDRVAFDELSKVTGRDRADDSVVDRLGVGLRQPVLTEQAHVAEDRALLVDVKRQLLAIRRHPVDADPNLLDDVYPIRRVVRRQDLLATHAVSHRGGVADGLHVYLGEAGEQGHLAEQADLLGE